MRLFRVKKIINDYTLLLLCISVSFLLMIFSRTPGQDTGLEEILFRFFGSINSPFVHLKTLRYVQQENRVLRFENTLLELEKMKYIETFYENKRLRMLLNFKDQDSIAVKPARVLSQSNIAGVKTITIDAGTMSGVRIDMPLVNSDGLIGRIIKTTSRYAIGQLLVDRNFRAAARIQQSREIGIYQNYDQQSGVLFGVHHRADVHIGDDVITMGKSSVFPAGLFIGTVARIDTTTSRLFKRVYVESKVNFTKLEEVFIVFNRTDE